MTNVRKIVPIRKKGLDPIGGKDPTFQGGSVLTSVQVQPVFWGAAWKASQAALIPELEAYFKFIVASSLIDMLAEYSVPGQTIQHGSVLNSVVESGAEPGGTTHSISDSEIQTQVDIWVKNGVLTKGKNALYFLFLPPGVTSTFPGEGTSCIEYCGYHNN